MAQRLVFTAKDGVVPMNELKTFVDTAVKYGVTTESASYECDGEDLRISLPLPKDVKVVGARVIKLKPKKKKAQQVDKQIEEHKEKKKNGNGEGYVPPVGRKTPPKQKKIKCPVCNVRKPVVTVSGVKSIKPHVSKGEPCGGSGIQVVRGRAVV